MKTIKSIIQSINTINVLFDRNQDAVQNYNINMLRGISSIGVFLFLLISIIRLTTDSPLFVLKTYSPCVFIIILCYYVFTKTKLKSKALYGMYIISIVMFLFGIHLSSIRSPQTYGTIIIGLFCFIPMCLFDKPHRVILLVTYMLIVNTIISLSYKDLSITIVDTENLICFSILSVYFSCKISSYRLELFESHRLLMIEKTTDCLTGLKNRRNLFEAIDDIRDGKICCPDGIMLLDLDNFKLVNDTFGHAAGDHCLNLYGSLLKTFEDEYSIAFYRYGGEEFVGFTYNNTDKEHLINIAEQIRYRTQHINTGYSKITVSIGAVYCKGKNVKECEKWIRRADEAAYAAKETGKNQVVCW